MGTITLILGMVIFIAAIVLVVFMVQNFMRKAVPFIKNENPDEKKDGQEK